MMQQPMHMGGQMMGGMPPQQMGGYGFAARPRIVKQKKYRDPYREYM